jgi:hypothetical protein
MKYLVRCLAILILAGAARAATVSGTITYLFTTSVACSATVNTNCLTGFNVGYITGTSFTPLLPVALPAALTGTATIPYTMPFNGIYGTSQIAVSVAYHDSQGNNLSSVPFTAPTASVDAQPNPATGLTAVATNP